MLVSLNLIYRALLDLVSLGLVGCRDAWARRGRSNIPRLDSRRRLRRCGASRHDPQLNTVFLAETTVDHNDSRFDRFHVGSPGNRELASPASLAVRCDWSDHHTR